LWGILLEKLLSTNSYEISGVVGCLTIATDPLDFGADPDRDWDQEILVEFLPLRDRGNSKSFAGPAALAKVCGLRELLVRTVFRVSAEQYNH